MTEASSAAQRSAGARQNSDRFRLIWVRGGILCALVLAVVLLRFFRLSELPAGINAGEGANGVDALRVLQGERAVFFAEKERGREGMVVYAIALAISLFGRTELSLHLPTALASAGMVFFVFWLGQILFGKEEDGGRATPWRGLLIGGVGAGLMAVSLGQTIIGRTAYRPPFCHCFFPCVWPCCGRGGRVGAGGGWRWLAYAPAFCRTPTFQRGSLPSCFSFSA